MARFNRSVGITQAKINIPQQPDVGPAIVRTANTVSAVVAERQGQQRVEEANLAAQALVFERNEDGNLVAPTTPVGKNGLVAPNIFSRQYTAMVGQRFMQQTNLDTAKQLNNIATDHPLDPEGFQEVAESYIQNVTDLAPAAIRGDVNRIAQERAVGHFNHIVRKRSEFDFNEASDTHDVTSEEMFKSLAGLAETGASDDLVIEAYVTLAGHIADGVDNNFFNSAGGIQRLEEMDTRLSLDFMAGEIAELPDTAVGASAAVEQFVRFMEGEGTIKVVRINSKGEGSVVEAPVTEIHPDGETRRAIAGAAIQLIQTRENARSGAEGDRFNTQSNEFYSWYTPHLLDRTRRGEQLDMTQLQSWHDEAAAKDNVPLQRQIAAIMVQAWNQNAGTSGTRAERRASQALQDVMQVHEGVDTAFTDKHGPDALNDMSPEQRGDYEDAKWRRSGPVDIPQSPQMAEELDAMYDSMAQNSIEVRPGMPNSSSLEEIEAWIEAGPGRVGVITWGLSIPLNSMLSSNNEQEIDRALSIGRMLFDDPDTQGNMTADSALGVNGEALSYLFEKYTPGNIEAGLVTDILTKFGNGWNPHKEWSAMNGDEKQALMAGMEEAFEGRFTSIAPGLTENPFDVQTFTGPLLSPTLGSYPVEMQEQVFHEIQRRAGRIDPLNTKSYSRHIDAAIDAVAKEQGWVPSRLGWSLSRFTDDRPSTFAFSQFAPEAFYRDPHGNTDKNVMAEVESDFATILFDLNKKMPGAARFVGGENAFLEYNREQSQTTPDGRHIPAYNIRFLQTDDLGTVATSDRFTYGDQFAISFESAFQRGNAKTIQEFEDQNVKNTAQRARQQEARANITNRRNFQ